MKNNDIADRFFYAQQKYNEKFGENSVAETFSCIFHHLGSDEEILELTMEMENAIKNNKPVPKFTPQEGMNIIY